MSAEDVELPSNTPTSIVVVQYEIHLTLMHVLCFIEREADPSVSDDYIVKQMELITLII